MNAKTEAIRNSIKTSVSEFFHFLSKCKDEKKKLNDGVTFDDLVRLAHMDWKPLKYETVIPLETFTTISENIDSLAKYLNPTKDDKTDAFLSGVRSIFKQFNVKEEDYWIDATIYRFNRAKPVTV